MKDATAVRAESGRLSMTVEVLAHSKKISRDFSQKKHTIHAKYDDVYTLETFIRAMHMICMSRAKKYEKNEPLEASQAKISHRSE